VRALYRRFKSTGPLQNLKGKFVQIPHGRLHEWDLRDEVLVKERVLWKGCFVTYRIGWALMELKD